MAKLTEKQKRFIDYYIETGNATEAAKRAGYRGKSYESVGSQNLIKLKVFVDEKIKQKDNERIASQEEVLQYLTNIMRGNGVEEVVAVEGRGDGCSEAKIVKKALNHKDRIKAAELLGKRYGIFTDKVSVEGPVPVVISGEDEIYD